MYLSYAVLVYSMVWPGVFLSLLLLLPLLFFPFLSFFSFFIGSLSVVICSTIRNSFLTLSHHSGEWIVFGVRYGEIVCVFRVTMTASNRRKQNISLGPQIAPTNFSIKSFRSGWFFAHEFYLPIDFGFNGLVLRCCCFHITMIYGKRTHTQTSDTHAHSHTW